MIVGEKKLEFFLVDWAVRVMMCSQSTHEQPNITIIGWILNLSEY